MALTPTDEQAEAIRLARSGVHLAIEALAGTGKTSTLDLISRDLDTKTGTYITFNRAIADDAARRFPRSVDCRTAHSLAFGAVGKRFQHRFKSPRMYGKALAEIIGIDALDVPLEAGGRKRLMPGKLATLAMRAIDEFCRTGDPVPNHTHVPWVDGIDPPRGPGSKRDNNRLVARHVAEWLPRIWADLCNVDGRLPYNQGCYLKLWQLSSPRINSDYLLYDEAQDANGAMLSIVEQQRDHAQLIFVGDKFQQIYAWNGAVNAMAKAPVDARTFLSQSFRFGPAVAEAANLVLEDLGAEVLVRGFDKIQSVVGHIDRPSAYLCRTNAKALSVAIDHIDRSIPVAIVGGVAELVSFADAAERLMEHKGTDHALLWCFSSWSEVLDYVKLDEHGDATELSQAVKLVERFGAAGLRRIIAMLATEDHAEVVVSTAHKSKGREWSAVKLADDYPDITPDRIDIGEEDKRLIYVATTRAKLALDYEQVGYLRLRRFEKQEVEAVQVDDAEPEVGTKYQADEIDGPATVRMVNGKLVIEGRS